MLSSRQGPTEENIKHFQEVSFVKHLLRTLVLTMVLCMVMSNAMAATLTAAEITNPDTDSWIMVYPHLNFPWYQNLLP